jgi:hypothetical protein
MVGGGAPPELLPLEPPLSPESVVVPVPSVLVASVLVASVLVVLAGS